MNRSDVVTMHLAAKRAAEVTRQWLETEAAAEYAEQGTAPSWRGRDFTVSTAVKTGGPAVADDAALLAWVRTNHPTEVEQVERVRPAFLSHLLAQASRLGSPCDDEGTVLPGVEWRDGGGFSHIAIKPSTAMRGRLDEFAAAIAAGDVPFALPEAVDA